MLPMTLKLADKVKIEGESLVTGFEKQIDIQLIDHSVSMPMAADKSSTSRTSGRVQHKPLACSMRINKAYPKLVEACAKGSNLGKVELTMLKIVEGKASVVAKYELTDVFLSDVALTPAPGDAGQSDGENAMPWVKFGLAYQSIAVSYTAYGANGESVGTVACEPITGLGC